MIARLVGVLGLLLAGLVLVPAGPAFACSCERLTPDEYVERADYAFSGTAASERASDSALVYRFSVDTVYRGRVSRTQDVVTPRTDSSCDLRLPVDEPMLLIGTLDDQGRVSLTGCEDATWSVGDPFGDRLVAALGTGSAPVPGRSEVELDRWTRDDVRWFTLAVGVIGLVALALQATRRWRARS